LKAWPSSAAVGQQVLFTYSVSDPNGDPVTVTYNYGDGSATGTTEKHAYTSAGNFTAVVTATDTHGGTATSSTVVTVFSSSTGPITISSPLKAWPNPVVAGSKVLFTIGVIDTNSWSIKWNYGDGSSGTTESHVYSTAGSYTATATVTDTQGKTGTSSVTVVVTQSALLHSASEPAAATPSLLSVSSLSVKLNFARKDSNSIVLTGTLPVSKGYKATGSVMATDVAGVSRTFMLSANATGKNGKSSSRVHIKSSKGAVAAQQSPFSIVIKSGDFAALGASGLTNANHSSDHASLPIMLVFNDTLYEIAVPVTVTGAAGKMLLAKK
jgi:PKD repeat protein